ncbi:STAS domain-containing protein [Sphingomonas sp. 22176]|uniref:STAS domain-containing protein n=1 Tax=Sphingomonas sp. 22176 TaxID=3453884 RepID=UPI003F83E53A
MSLTMRNIAEFYRALIARCETDSSLCIDLASVEEADLSLLQLLTALRDAGGEVRLRSPAPAPVAALLERAGFLAAPSAQDLDFWFHGERAQ